MTKQQHGTTKVEFSAEEIIDLEIMQGPNAEEQRRLVPIEDLQLPTLYPGADRSGLSHEQKLAVMAYEGRYRESTETLHDLRLKLPGTRLAVTGIFIEDDVEMEARDNNNQPITDKETGEVEMTLKDMTMVRVSAMHYPGKDNVVTNEVYFSSASPIVKRFFMALVNDFNHGHMGDFEVFVPVEVYNKVYRNGHTGIGLKVVEEL